MRGTGNSVVFGKDGKGLSEADRKKAREIVKNKIGNKIDSVQNKGDAKWQNFKSEIAEAWDHFKKAF